MEFGGIEREMRRLRTPRRKLQKGEPDSSSARKRGDDRRRVVLSLRAIEEQRIKRFDNGEGLPPHV